MREVVVRARLLFEFLLAIPLFILLIVINPEYYARTLGDSERSIRRRVLRYRKAALRLPGNPLA
jgi:hypothetical protein